MDDHIPPPFPGLLALEGRAWLEFAALLPALPLLARAPRGDGHPVLVLPGWLAGDGSTRTLRAFLRNRGYHVHGWRLGTNMGPRPDTIVGLGRRFAALRARHSRKITVIGWSLGGIYARELARRFPADVRQVITLASPFRDPFATCFEPFLRWRYGSAATRAGNPAALRRPLDVPSTSIYSRTDGIVAWRSCLEDDGPFGQSIEVQTSHLGMGHHPSVLLLIADRLAQPENGWRRFTPRGWWPWASGLFARSEAPRDREVDQPDAVEDELAASLQKP